jgi:hypothetical protein
MMILTSNNDHKIVTRLSSGRWVTPYCTQLSHRVKPLPEVYTWGKGALERVERILDMMQCGGGRNQVRYQRKWIRLCAIRFHLNNVTVNLLLDRTCP